jgi:hypothetical protein
MTKLDDIFIYCYKEAEEGLPFEIDLDSNLYTILDLEHSAFLTLSGRHPSNFAPWMRSLKGVLNCRPLSVKRA